MSAIECACWHITGEVYNLPVWKHLGRKLRDRISVYRDTPQQYGISALQFAVQARPLSLKVSNVSVTEGDSGRIPFTAEVSLSSTYPTVTVLVRVTATPGTAEEKDYALRLHIEGAVFLEGNQGTSIAELSVKLEPASTNTVTVAYQTQDNSAKAGADYLPAQGRLTFAPGEVLRTIPGEILGDVEPEP